MINLEKKETNKVNMPLKKRDLIDRVHTLVDRYYKGRKAVEAFSQAVGFNPSTVFNWFSYRAAPAKTALNRISDYFPDINPKWLFYGEPPMERVPEQFPVEKLRGPRLKAEVDRLKDENKRLLDRIQMLEDKISLQGEYIEALKKLANKAK